MNNTLLIIVIILFVFSAVCGLINWRLGGRGRERFPWEKGINVKPNKHTKILPPYTSKKNLVEKQESEDEKT